MSHDELKRRYAAAKTHYAKGVIEGEIWAAAPDAARAEWHKYRARYVAQVLDLKDPDFHAIKSRIALAYAGKGGITLLERLDIDMPFTTAIRLLADARALAAKASGGKRIRVPDAFLADYISQVLEAYDRRPYVIHRPDGKFVRHPLSAAQRRKKARKAPPVSSSSAPPAKPPDTQPSKPMSQQRLKTVREGRDFWGGLREQLSAFLEERLADCDPLVRETERSRFMVELEHLLTAAIHRIDGQRRRGKAAAAALSRREFNHACAVLQLDPPRNADGVFMKKARRRQRQLAREYHPDTTGNDSTREMYQAVIEAWAIIERFYEQETSHDNDHHSTGA